MNNFQSFLPDRDPVVILQPAIRGEDFRCRKAEHLALHRQALNPEVIFYMGAFDGHSCTFRQRRGASGMVDVGVSQQDFFQHHTLGLNRSPNAIQISARVDHRGFVGFGAPEQGAVLLERSHRNHAVLQGHNRPRLGKLGREFTKPRMGGPLNDYLEKIRQGKAINYEAFLRKLPASVRAQHRALFATEKMAANRWQVRVLDPEAFTALQQQAAQPLSRLDAARKGDSHRHPTQASFLLVYHCLSHQDRPDTVVLADGQVHQGFQPAARVLVVENEQNFYHYRQMLAFAERCQGRPCGIDTCDLVLGSGNRITAAADLAWLNGYDEVLCAFDYDGGGLQMFATIRASLGDKAQFLQPVDWQPWLARFRKSPESTEKFVKALGLAEELGFTALAQAFRATGKFMEQEMILDD